MRSAALRFAAKARPFSGEVVTLRGHAGMVRGVAAASDGRIITGSYDRTVKVWRDGACERTIQAHIRGHRVRGGAAGRSALRHRLG